ncbi:MAG: bifunctional riboflavin kinase/FMN adenylyltransferase, partial [Desulfuromonadales bacterium]|nr:bifunctional riboflavin kinase/FMN adenylyltransferase [Desulfuromonadales bacterium]NIS41970.1 bifunctional riboflavin kinase/FMN adenylyltransferase [Desulfuromonadales bacterium]
AGYVGPRPTFGAGDEPVLEAYLLDFSGDLYDHVVEVEFINFLRPDHTFDSAEALA